MPHHFPRPLVRPLAAACLAAGFAVVHAAALAQPRASARPPSAASAASATMNPPSSGLEERQSPARVGAPLDLPAAAASGAAAAKADPSVPRLTLSALVDAVLSHNPALLAAERARDAASANVLGARALPNPSLDYGTGRQRPRFVGGASGSLQSYGVSQLIENPSVRAARIEAATAFERGSGQQVALTRNELIAQVRLGAYTHLLRQAEAVVAGEALALLEQVHGRVRSRVDSGEAPRYELIKADAEVIHAASQRQSALLLAEQASIELNRLAAGRLPARWALDADLDSEPEVRDLADTQARAREHNPELRALQAEFDRARALLDGARAERWPGVTVSYSGNRDPEVRQNTLGVSVQVPLFDRRTGPVAAAVAELERTRATLDGRRAELDQRVLHAWRSLEMAQLRVKALGDAAVRDAESALRVADAAYRYGERGILDVLDAQRVLRGVRADLLNARYEVRAAQTELDLLSGRWADPLPTPSSR